MEQAWRQIRVGWRWIDQRSGIWDSAMLLQRGSVTGQMMEDGHTFRRLREGSVHHQHLQGLLHFVLTDSSSSYAIPDHTRRKTSTGADPISPP